MADDKLINIIRPTLIKAQREVAAYEKKRDAMKGKVNLAEANRCSTGSILTAETVGQKLFNAASFLSAGAKEAACKTELAMLERQIKGFKEEFGTEMYPVFQSMEDNEGWLPTDRKVRSLYDQAREDIAEMEKSKEEKKEQIKQLDGLEGSGLTPPSVPVAHTPAAAPMAVATPVGNPLPSNNQNGQSQWATTASVEPSAAVSYGTSYGSSHQTTSYGSSQPSNYGVTTAAAPVDNSFGSIDKMQSQTTGFEFMQNQQQPSASAMSLQQPAPSAMSLQQPTSQFGSSNNINSASVFDPFDGLSSAPSQSNNFGSIQTNVFGAPAPAATFNSTAAPAANKNAFDPFAGNSSTLSNADMNLFKY